MQQNPSKTSGASFSLFYGDCVSDFHNASEFSKQSKFWFVWGKRCCPRKDPCFSLESVNVAFLSRLAFQKDIISQENWKRSSAWDFRESRLVIWKNCLNFLKIADIGNIYIECVSNGFWLKILKNFKLWIFLEKQVGLFGK